MALPLPFPDLRFTVLCGQSYEAAPTALPAVSVIANGAVLSKFYANTVCSTVLLHCYCKLLLSALPLGGRIMEWC